ncbi:U37-like protein [Lissonota sp. PSUC_FEM 10030012]|nr:U37-like protein [Lissonota sp. PSUC_FEM 10030012]
MNYVVVSTGLLSAGLSAFTIYQTSQIDDLDKIGSSKTKQDEYTKAVTYARYASIATVTSAAANSLISGWQVVQGAMEDDEQKDNLMNPNL